MNQKDLRVIKTRKNIEESFIKLLSQKDFSKITVQDILSEALINRSTFYKHYKDKYDVSEQLCHKIYDIFTENVKGRFSSYEKDVIISYVKQLYFELYKHKEQILCLFTVHTDTIHLYDDMCSFLKTSFYGNFTSNATVKNTTALDYLSNLYASLVMTSIKWCLETDNYDALEKYCTTFLDVFSQYQKILFK